MEPGRASVGPRGEVAHGASTLPDLARAGDVIRQLRDVWPDEAITPYVGLNGGRPCVGFITDRHRGAIRFTAETLDAALRRALMWASANAWRLRWETMNDRLEHPRYRRVPPRSEHPKEN